MSDYFIKRCKEHVATMRIRETLLENEISVMTAKLGALIDERKNRQFGVINWQEEEAERRHDMG